MSDKKINPEHGVVVEERIKVKKPSLYKVLLLNDDYTPMDFVVHILKVYFQKDEVAAHEIMIQVHTQGRGIAGVYSYDVAESKVVQVIEYAKKNDYPLKAVLEKE